MRQYMLDTCTVSYIINHQYPKVRTHLLYINQPVCISSITQGELLYGLNKKGNPALLSDIVYRFFNYVEILTWGSAEAAIYGELRAQNQLKGISLGALDGLIAAHAIAQNCVLVTSDHAFNQINTLRVEDWTI